MELGSDAWLGLGHECVGVVFGQCGFERGEPHTVRELGDASHLGELQTSPCLQDGIFGAGAGENRVDYPSERFDAGAAEVGLEDMTPAIGDAGSAGADRVGGDANHHEMEHRHRWPPQFVAGIDTSAGTSPRAT